MVQKHACNNCNTHTGISAYSSSSRPTSKMRSELEPEPELMTSHTITTPKRIGPHEPDPQEKYAPFARHDSYGIVGRGQLPWTEKVLLAVAMLTLLPLRVAAATTLVVLCYLTCRICTAFLPPNEHGSYAHLKGWRRKVIMASSRFTGRALLFAFGFYWIHETHPYHHHIPPPNSNHKARSEEEEEERAGVIVSNHVSYTDILYHMSSSCASFVAKKSVAKLPLVGLISKCLGCISVQRECKTPDLTGVSGVVNQRIQEAYKNKSSPMVIIFPEGTTTNGDFLLPFKTGAFVSKAPVHPVIIRYPYRRLSPAWDSISGARHLILLLCQFVNHMEVVWLPVYYPSQQEKDDPKLYAENVRRFMAHEGSLILSDIGLAEKRAYLSACNGNTRSTANNHQKDN